MGKMLMSVSAHKVSKLLEELEPPSLLQDIPTRPSRSSGF